MRILIAEDDPVLADGLLQSLRQSGYAVDWVKNGGEADAGLGANDFDLLILDIGLPKLSGFEVLKRLRARNSRLPVLMLTARDGVDDRVRGLDLGADDYLAKPFELAELKARVRALTRRGMSGAPTLIRHGRLTFDQVGRVADLDGERVELSARELEPSRASAAAPRTPGAQGPARRASVRMGRGGQHQCHRSLCAPAAPQTGARRCADFDGARCRLLPRGPRGILMRHAHYVHAASGVGRDGRRDRSPPCDAQLRGSGAPSTMRSTWLRRANSSSVACRVRGFDHVQRQTLGRQAQRFDPMPQPHEVVVVDAGRAHGAASSSTSGSLRITDTQISRNSADSDSICAVTRCRAGWRSSSGCDGVDCDQDDRRAADLRLRHARATTCRTPRFATSAAREPKNPGLGRLARARRERDLLGVAQVEGDVRRRLVAFVGAGSRQRRITSCSHGGTPGDAHARRHRIQPQAIAQSGQRRAERRTAARPVASS